MAGPLRQGTATSVLIGPFLDDTDFKTPETALTVASIDVDLYKHADTQPRTKTDIIPAASGSSNDMAHVANGQYSLELTTSNTDTLGHLRLTANIAGALPVTEDFVVITQVMYDSLIDGTDKQQVDVVELVGATQSVADLKDFADDGYDPATNKVEGVKLADTLTTYTGNTPQTGNSYARLGAPVGASVSSDIAAIAAMTDDIGVAGAGLTAVPVPANLDVAVSTRLAAGAYTAPDNVGIAAIGAAVDTEVAAIKTNTDKVGTAMELDGAVYRFTTNALEQAPGGGGGPVGPGATSYPVTVTEADLITPIDGVAVWVTTDVAGTNTIAGTLYTDALGRINGTVGFMLNAGSYYLWRERSGWNFLNPVAFTVV